MRQHAGSVGGAAVVGPVGRSRSVLSPAAAPVTNAECSLSPTVDLKIVLFTIADGRLQVALHNQNGALHLPVGMPQPNQSLDAEARRIARETIGLQEQYLEQLNTLSVHEPAGWVITVGYLGLICSNPDATPAVGGWWYEVDALPPLSRTDRMVVDYALLRLRAKLAYTTIAFHLLPATFTLSELQGAYEAILDRRLDKRNFRRRVTAAGMLETTGAKRREGSHRPALLYRFRAVHDRETYLTPPWAEGG